MFQKILLTIALSTVFYWLLAYQLLPKFWHHFEHNRFLESEPKVTHTKEGIPGDPINIALVGTQDEIVEAMHAAKWAPADALTLKTTAKIVKSVLFKTPYPEAPVSPLYLFGRKEDLAFEQPATNNIKKRHHVRFWQSNIRWKDGRSIWLGAATFDISYGFSHYTGQILHHIDANVDQEREKLFFDLVKARAISFRYQVNGIGPTLLGHNGEGDRYYTDGKIDVGVLLRGILF